MIANDNNYPFDAGRHDGIADGNEWIIVRPAAAEVDLGRRVLRADVRERVKVRYRLEREATVSLEVRSDGHVFERREHEVRAGVETVDVRAPRKPGHYTLRITATLGDVDDSDTARLLVE